MKKRKILLIIIIILAILIISSLVLIDSFQGPKEYVSKQKLNNYITKFTIAKDQNLIVSFDQNIYEKRNDFYKNADVNGKSIPDFNLDSKIPSKYRYLLVNYLLYNKLNDNGIYYNQFFICEDALNETKYVYSLDSNESVCGVYYGRENDPNYYQFPYLDIDFDQSLYSDFKDKQIKINDADIVFLKIDVKNMLNDSPKLYKEFKREISPFTKYIPRYYVKVNDYEIIE